MENSLEWGVIRPVGYYMPTKICGINFMSVDDFLYTIGRIKADGLGPLMLYIEHFEIMTVGQGFWRIRSKDFETVTSEIRRNFKNRDITGHAPLKGMPLDRAVRQYLDIIFGMYKQ